MTGAHPKNDQGAVHGQTTEPAPKVGSTSKAAPTARERLASLASHLLPQGQTEFDYVIVGGGTAGAVLANRLTQDSGATVAVIEGGPSDVGLDVVLDLSRWLELLGSELDYDYPTTEQPRGNSHIRHSRARVLGGCSSHNTLISFRPFNEDLDLWAKEFGCPSWDSKTIQPYGDRLKLNTLPVAHQQRNNVVRDWVSAASSATGAPVIDDFNAQIVHKGGFSSGVGFFNISYDPHNGHRSSASTAYLHPIMPHSPQRRNNLHLFLETWARNLVWDEHDSLRARGVAVRTKYGLEKTITARREVVLAAGAIDTPRLLLLSGVGPKAELEKVGVPVHHDLPGVGENLVDHPESIWMAETRHTPPETVMSSDAGLFLRIFPSSAEPWKAMEQEMSKIPDLMFHIYQVPFADNTERMGYERPKNAICMTPNIPRSQAKGKLSLASNNPAEKPLLNFRYFEDANDYDAKVLVQGIHLARKIAKSAPFSQHIVKEVAPGPNVQTDEEISEYARRAAHTVYHPAGTCRMGTPSTTDPLVVVNEADLRVVGLKGLRVCDASLMPLLPTVNPMITVLMMAERASDLINNDAWLEGYRKTTW
ncbi:alcohol oxidase [Ceraceosorus guamensis]|uniref:Alcohol oxidase n=1 Tax=Ceraceosorus guamensis TaxID=1522189 RepID=A0A316VXQ5_9BASI|nr:alcohol oxidase [Ceraceosorus guamensis]PWN41183.1 alcohol oxidase [Ceraceosorus guamensis]